MAILFTQQHRLRRLFLVGVAFLLIVLFLRSPSRPSSTSTSSPFTVNNPVEPPHYAAPVRNDDPSPAKDESVPAAVAKAEAPPKPSISLYPRQRLSSAMQKHLEWKPPVEIKNHYPPYDAYEIRDYDPNRWEAFEQNQAYYWNGSINQIPSKPQNPAPYNPYPTYSDSQWMGKLAACDGAHGSVIEPTSTEAPRAYGGLPAGFPKPNSGSFEAVGLDNTVCFDRESRMGPYGLSGDVDFSKVNWMRLQNRCTHRNAGRFEDARPPKIGPKEVGLSKRAPPMQDTRKQSSSSSSSKSYRKRTAVLIRTWDNYEYQPNDIQAIRSLITELNLLSGGEYHVFLFVNVKDENAPIYTDQRVHDELLERHVPPELRSIAVLWTEAICHHLYPNVGEWSVYFQQWMPLQWFSKTHPEFEYIWNWEMDARYIGNHYHFMEQVAAFAKKQPRKYLWERNARYYFPSVHGSWKKYFSDTNKIVENSPFVEAVWGPDPWTSNQTPRGPKPPTTMSEDKYQWGVGEEADFITLLPVWDPRETWWSYRDKLWGYPHSESSTEERPYPHVPRRTFINTLARLSKTLLDTMDAENAAGVSMASEMWPSSTALQHGFKAVYAPHPIWFSQVWPYDYLDPVFNPDGWGAGSHPGGYGFIDDGRGRAYDPECERQGKPPNGTGPNGEGLPGRWGQERDAPYNPDREHNFGGWSWYFWSDFPKVLYWRWLGWKAGFAIVTIEGSRSNDDLRDVDWAQWEKENGRLCYPAMLLHPIKNVREKQEEAQAKR